MSFWLIQALGLVGSLISLTSLQSGSRRKILLLQIFCCVLWITHYALLGAFTGVLSNLLGLLRGPCNFRPPTEGFPPGCWCRRPPAGHD